jgi:NCAIR mutase (PurE)-related protein
VLHRWNRRFYHQFNMRTPDLKQLAERLIAGELTLDDFVRRAAEGKTADLGEVRLDLDRSRRCGFPEVIFAEGKTTKALEKIFSALLERNVDVLATRMSAEKAEALLSNFPTANYNPLGRTFRIPSERVGTSPSPTLENSNCQGRVTIVSAGTSDMPVAEEARETALWTGARVTMIPDVGVAGPHRLVENLPLLEDADAVVVVAGMEGALPSVVGGHVACPVIAVPTSVGYGASFGGVAALLAMLNSCAANVCVVNIDAGFKGGYVAGLIAKNAAKAREKNAE